MEKELIHEVENKLVEIVGRSNVYVKASPIPEFDWMLCIRGYEFLCEVKKTVTRSNFGSVCAINDAKLTTLPVISREGYVFDGWYTPNNILAYAGMSVTNDMILTAHWTKQIQKTDDNKNQVVDDKKYELDYDADDEIDDEIDDDTLMVGDELETDQAIYTITETEGGYCVEF